MRHPDFLRLVEARVLRAKGHTIRDIAEKMHSDVKTVHRWLNYDLRKYPKYAEVFGIGAYPQEAEN